MPFLYYVWYFMGLQTANEQKIGSFKSFDHRDYVQSPYWGNVSSSVWQTRAVKNCHCSVSQVSILQQYHPPQTIPWLLMQTVVIPAAFIITNVSCIVYVYTMSFSDTVYICTHTAILNIYIKLYAAWYISDNKMKNLSFHFGAT